MSGTATPRGIKARAMEAGCLAIVFALLWLCTKHAPGHHDDASLVAGLGFLLLAGTLTSELIEVFRVPHLTGYLLAGMLAGPHVLHLIDHASVKRLEPVNTLTLALIALAGGCELRVDALRKGLRSLVVAMGVQCVLGLLFVGGIFMLAAPVMIPFAKNMPTLSVFGVALLWGVLAISRSPSATLGVLSQTRAQGPLTTFTLGFVMSSDVVVVILLAGAIGVARPLMEPGAVFSLQAFGGLGHEIIGSVSVGTTLGLVLAVYLKLIGRQLLVVLIALGFGATEVLRYLHFDPVLAFLVAGFVVQNLSKQGERFMHAIEGASGVVYVVFFASAGSHLDLPLLKELWPVALLLAGSRALITYASAKLASRIADDPPRIRKWGWAPLISQAGLTLGLSAVIAREFPAFGASFRALAIATVALNEIVGPILFKLALDRTQETRGQAPALVDAEDTDPKPA
ncbi:MAG TPA: cation:proton antiporter [Labilithrix sp.]|nr:cation:proton antiporter [Labilithrix sp.]